MSKHCVQRTFTFVFLGCLALSLFCVIYPIYVIRPFRAQGARELEVALTIIRFRPVITVVTAIVAVVALIRYWPAQRRKWKRVLVAVGTGFVALLAFLARVNVYELMFHPIDRPSFGAAAQVKLDPDEKVVAVQIGGEARAYPIRNMSYHHVLNDVVAGVAIVATY
jgi:hypothetical protein